MNAPTFRFDDGPDPVLQCPVCGFPSLNQYRVELFERSNPEQTGIHITVESTHVCVDDSMHDNPSFSNKGLLVHLWCDNCHAQVALALAHHKGQTLVTWQGGSK